MSQRLSLLSRRMFVGIIALLGLTACGVVRVSPSAASYHERSIPVTGRETARGSNTPPIFPHLKFRRTEQVI